MDNNLITIANDFSVTPGSRYRTEGPFSGEEFREDVLAPKFVEVLARDEKLTINLDGTLGYGTSFLEEAFGGLARIHNSQLVLDHIEIISTEEPYLKDDVLEYIEKAND